MAKSLKWIESFLKNRFQSVIVDGILSEPAPVISGVPQGSVLGPLIFLILIGDIDNDISNSSVRSFADDTRLIKSVISIEDTEALQEDWTTVYNWANVNNMKFNDIKFKLLRYGPSKISNNPPAIPQVATVSYLKNKKLETLELS